MGGGVCGLVNDWGGRVGEHAWMRLGVGGWMLGGVGVRHGWEEIRPLQRGGHCGTGEGPTGGSDV